jgi:hypothetical protein
LITLRLVLDITRTHDGLYQGRVAVPGTSGEQDFTGILELLAIIEQQVQPSEPDDDRPSGSGAAHGADGSGEASGLA